MKIRHPPYLHVDAETYSAAPLDVVGSYAYARHPSTDVLCLGYYCDLLKEGGVWHPDVGNMPALIKKALEHGTSILAHNAEFDAEIWRWVLAEKYGWVWPGYEAFVDTMAMGQIFNLPGKLEKAAAFIGRVHKDVEGHRLMMKMCKPAPPTQDDDNPRRLHTQDNLLRLYRYCKQDVKAERNFALQIPPLSEFEEQVWRATWDMNIRGVRVDVPLVEELLRLSAGAQEHYRGVLSEVTDGVVERETQRPTLGKWLSKEGAQLPLTPKGNPSFSKDNADLVDTSHASERAQEAFDLYNLLNNSSLAKLNKMLACLGPDGKLHGMFRYSGAGQTGRWAGQHVQLQNLFKGIIETEDEYEEALSYVREGTTWQELELMYGNSLNIISTLIRCCLIPDDGNRFVVADYSAIEGRVLAWEAGEEHVLEAYRQGKRLYAVAAAGIFNCSYEQVMREREAGNSLKDRIGKTADLACGYQGGIGAFIKMGGRKLNLTNDRIKDIVNAWRDDRGRTVKYWYDMQEAAMRAIRRPGRKFECGPVSFGCSDNRLMMRLPSGRKLYYHHAKITDKIWPDGGKSPQITYYGVDEGKVGWLSTYGGKLAQGATQAIARDLLADATVRANKAGYRLVMTVHDELVADEPVDGRTHRDLCKLMTDIPAWAKGIPVAAAGFTGSYYRKG